MRRSSATLAAVALLVSPALADLTLSDFDNTGFQWTYADFAQTIGPQFVTIADATDGWGGGGFSYSNPRNLSTLADGYLRIDARVNTGHGTNMFALALRDADDNQGKWNFSVSGVSSSGFTQLKAQTTLANPQTGLNDWQNLDLSRITAIEMQGQWSGGTGFNMSFDNFIIEGEGFVEKYPGHAPAAPWRAQAAQRIDQIRKAPLTVTVRDLAGNPVSNAQVQVRQKSHEFGFGSAVVLNRLASNTAQNTTYKQKVKELFNIAVNENDLKWPAWDGEWGGSFTQANAIAGLDWLRANEITPRGHVFVWPGYNNLPNPVQAMIDEYRLATTSAARKTELQGEMRQAVLDHIQDMGTKTAGKVDIWDVINETRANHDLMDILGNSVMTDWFNAAKAVAPNAQMFINEYDIITSTGSAVNSRNTYYNTIQSLMNAGAPVEGIGMQGHFSPNSLTGPEQVWAVLDRFSQLGVPIQVTEFDLDTTDRELQRDYLRDFMTALFAHENVSDFIQWGFWAGAHWRPDAAMFDANWNPRLHADEYMRLVFDEWWTSQDLLSQADGEASLRAFLGEYDITVAYNDFLRTTQLSLDSATGNYELVVVVPEPAGMSLLAAAGLLLGRRRRA